MEIRPMTEGNWWAVLFAALVLVGCDASPKIDWEVELGAPPVTVLTVDGTTAWIGVEGGTVVAVNVSGARVEWRREIPGRTHFHGPLLAGLERIYLRAWDGGGQDPGTLVHALDRMTGEILWVSDAPVNEISLAGDRVLAGGSSQLRVLDGRTGRVAGSIRMSAGRVAVGGAEGQDRSTLYATVQRHGVGGVVALDRSRGFTRWTFLEGRGVTGPPVVTPEAVLIRDGISEARLWALAPATGEELWSVDLTAPALAGWMDPPVLENGRIYLTANIGYQNFSTVHVLEAGSGQEIWRDSIMAGWASEEEGAPRLTQPVVVDGIVYVAGVRSVYALDAATGERLWVRDLEARPTSLGYGAGSLVVATADGRLLGLPLGN